MAHLAQVPKILDNLSYIHVLPQKASCSHNSVGHVPLVTSSIRDVS